jgi:hypothetical protein
MFDPRIGRWLEMDPIAFDAGDANLYRAMGNNPTNATDASGLRVGPLSFVNPWTTNNNRTHAPLPNLSVQEQMARVAAQSSVDELRKSITEYYPWVPKNEVAQFSGIAPTFVGLADAEKSWLLRAATLRAALMVAAKAGDVSEAVARSLPSRVLLAYLVEQAVLAQDIESLVNGTFVRRTDIALYAGSAPEGFLIKIDESITPSHYRLYGINRPLVEALNYYFGLLTPDERTVIASTLQTEAEAAKLKAMSPAAEAVMRRRLATLTCAQLNQRLRDILAMLRRPGAVTPAYLQVLQRRIQLIREAMANLPNCTLEDDVQDILGEINQGGQPLPP